MAERRDGIKKLTDPKRENVLDVQNGSSEVEEIDELSAVNEYLADGEKDIVLDEVLKSEPKRQSAGERRRCAS